MAESEAKKQSLDTLFNLSPKPTATPMPILTPQPGYVPPPLTRMGPPAANPADVSMESGNISDNDSDTSSESDISMSSDTGSLHMSLSPNPIRSQTASVSPRPFNSVSPSPMPPLFTNQKKASNLDSLLGKLKAKIPDTSSATDVSVKSESSTSDDNFVPPPPSLTRRAETASPAPDKSRRKQAAPKPSEETFKQATPTKSEPDDPFSAVDSMLMDCEVVKPVEAPNSPMIDVDDDGDIDEYPVRISRKGRVVKKPSWAQAYTDHSTTEDDNDPDYFSSEDFSESGRGGGSGSFAVKSTSDSFRPRRAPVIPSFAAGARIPQSDLPASMRSEPKPEWLIPFKKGWIRELVIRNPPDDEHMLNPSAKFTNADAYYYAPKELGSVKLRSLVKIEEFLDQQEQKTGLSSIHFTFQKRAVYQDPEEFVRMAGKTGVTVKSRKPSPQKQVKPEKVASKPPVKKVKGNDGKARPAQPSSDGTKSALQMLSNFKSVSSSTSSLPGISLPGSSLPGISLSGISLPRRSLPGSSLSGSRLIPQTRPHLAPQTVQVVRVQPPSAVSPKLIRIVNSMGKTITIPTSNQHVLPPKVVQCTSVPNTMSVPFKIITSAGNTINVNPGTQPQIRTKTPSSLFPARPIQIITPTLKKVAISSIPQIISLPSAVGSRISTPAAGVTIVSTQPNPISIKTIRPSAPRSESTRIHADLNAVNRAREYIRHAASHDPPDSNAAMTVTGPPGKPPASLQKILPPCNRSCPRVESFAVPTLQCGVCLLLYHHQCVNWASSNTDSLFVCSRCILRARHPNFDSKYKLSTNDGRKVELFDGSTRLIETLGAKNSNNNNAIEVNSKPEVSSKPKGRWITIPSTALSKIDKAAPFALKLSTGTYRINPKNMEVTSNGMSLKVYVAESSLMPYSSKVTSSVPAAPSETPSQAMKRVAPSQTTASKIIAPLTVIYNKLSDHLSSSKSSSKSTIAVTKPSNQKNCDKSKSPEPTNPSSVNNLASIQKDSEESSNQRQVADNESTNGKNLSEITNDSSSVNSSETSNESEDDEGALAIDEANTSEESNETPADINSGSIETEKPPVTTENDDSSKLEPSSEPHFPGPPAGLTAEFQALNSPTSDQKATRPCPNMSEPEMGVEATQSAIKSNRETAHSIQDSRDDLNGSERKAHQGAENSGLNTTPPIIVGLKAYGVRDKFEEANTQNDLRLSEEATRGAETYQLEANGGGTRSHCETDSKSPRSNQDVKQSAHKSCCGTGEAAKHSGCEVPESGDVTAGDCCGDFHQELDEVSPMAKTPKFETSKAVNSFDAVATRGCGNSVNPETSTALGEQLGVKGEKGDPLVVRPLKPLRLVTSGSSIGCDGVKEDEHNPEIFKGADNLKAADRDGDGDETEEIKPRFSSATISSLDGNADSNSDATSAKSRSSEDITGDQMDTLDDENSIPPRKSNKELELIENKDGTTPKPDENLNVITDVVNLLVQAVDIYAKSLDLADKAERELLNQTSTPQKPSTSLSDNAFIRNALYDKQDEDKKMKDLNKPCDPRHPKLGDKVPSMSELLYDPPSPIPSSPAFTYTYGRSSSSQSRRTPDVAIRSLNRTPRPLSGSMGSNSAALYQSVGQPRGVASNLATQGQPRGVAKNLATQGQPRGVFNNMMTQGQPRGVFNSMVMQGQPRGVANKITTLAKTMQRPLQTFTSPATQSILSSRPKPCVPAQHTVLPGNYKGQPPRIISNSSSAGKQTVVVSSTDSRVIVVPTLAAVPRRSIFVPRIVVTASPPPRVLSPPLTATGARFSTARLVPVSSSLTNSNRARHPPISAVDPSTGFSRIVLTPPVHSSAPTLKLIRAPAYPQIVQSAGYSQTTIQPRGKSAIVTIYQQPTEKQAPYVSQSNAFLTERNVHTGRSIPTLPVQSVTSKSNVVTIRPPPSYIIPPSHPMTNVSTTSAISQFKLSPATTTSQSTSRSQGWLSVQTNTNVPATRRSINVNRTTGTQTLKHLTDKICRSCSKKKAPTRSILSQSNDLYTVLQLVFCGKESPFGDYHLSIPDLTSCASVCRLWRLIAAESLTQRELEPQPQIENWYSSQAVGIPYYEMEGENDLETSMQFTVEAIQSDDEYADQSDDLYSDQLNTGIYDLETSQVLQSADCVLPARASDEKYECQTGVVNTDASGSSSQDNGNDAERANKTDNQSETVEGGATGKSSDDNPNTYSNEPIGDNNEATTGELIADNDETTTGELIADNNEVIEGENVALQISMLDSDSDIDSGSLDGFHVGNVQGNVESATDSAADSMAADFLTDEINQAAGATENTQTGTSQTNQAGAPEATPADATDTNPADTTKTTPGDATETHPADATTTSGLTTETN